MPFYNDFDKTSCAWLRELMREHHIPFGVVDGRSIADLRGADCAPFRQCHFFAGIGGWPLALELAGVPKDVNIWTGSCPCQPFSVAGAGRGTSDPRHLWPEFARLIGECRPSVVVGEQVASRAGRGWLAGVRVDLEAMGYAVGAADLCAASVGAPHIRQRLYWVAYRDGQGWRFGGRAERLAELPPGHEPDRRGALGGVADADSVCSAERAQPRPTVGGSGSRGLAAWSRYDICTDRAGKARRIEPGLVPLAYGLPGRVGLLRGYGNAIVPQLAAAFLVAAGVGRCA